MRRTLALAALVVAGGLLGVVGFASAGDDVSLVEVEPGAAAADPGETVELDVVVDSDGGHDDAGVYHIRVRVDYPPAYLEVVDVAVRGWFDADAEAVATRTGVDRTAGVVAVEQRLRNPETGATGRRPAATVRFRVREDADPANVRVAVSNSELEITRSPYPLPVVPQGAEIAVDGGGEVVDPDTDGEFSFEATTPTGTPTSTETPTPSATETPTPRDGSGAGGDGAFSPLVAVIAGLLAWKLLRRRGV